MSVYNFLSWFPYTTSVKIYNNEMNDFSYTILYKGTVADIPAYFTSCRLCSAHVMSGVLVLYCEVEE